jgi:hypothetical protein
MRNYTLPDQEETSAAESGAPEPLHARPQILRGATETLALRLFSDLHWHLLHTSLIYFKYLHPCNYITVLDNIHRPVFYLNHGISKTGFCLWNPLSWVKLMAQMCRFHMKIETESNLRNV